MHKFVEHAMYSRKRLKIPLLDRSNINKFLKYGKNIPGQFQVQCDIGRTRMGRVALM